MSNTNTKALFSLALIICIMLTTFGLADTRIKMSGSFSSSASDTTIGEDNALRVGKDYLNVMGFSYEGLIHQLEYEGFSHAEAVYACDILFERNSLPVKKGSNGSKVREVQEQLVELGFLSGSIDGIFGNGTEKAVKSFQESRGLKATGIVDETTYDELYKDPVEEQIIDPLEEQTTDSATDISSVSTSSDEWICVSCNTIAKGNFCSNCGNPKSEEWKCTNCGNMAKENFCSNCGTTKNNNANVSNSAEALIENSPEEKERDEGNANTGIIHLTTKNMRPTILETSNIKVRFNKFNYANSKTVFGVNFIVENDTAEGISVVLTDVTVNGYDVSTSTGKTLVEAGHKANCDSSVWQKSIDETGESEWTTIEGVVEIRKGYFGDSLYSIPVIIDKACWEYEEEYAENNPITPIISSDLDEIPEGAIIISSENLYPVLVEADGVSASISSYGYANGKTVFKINFSLENNTAEDLSIVLTDVIIDGYDISTSTGKSLVETGHKSVCDSSVWLRDMTEVGINDWIVLKGTIEIREGYWGDAIHSIPVVIYRNAWTSAA